MILLSFGPEGARRAQGRWRLNLEGAQCAALGAHAAPNINPSPAVPPAGRQEFLHPLAVHCRNHHSLESPSAPHLESWPASDRVGGCPGSVCLGPLRCFKPRERFAKELPWKRICHSEVSALFPACDAQTQFPDWARPLERALEPTRETSVTGLYSSHRP